MYVVNDPAAAQSQQKGEWQKNAIMEMNNVASFNTAVAENFKHLAHAPLESGTLWNQSEILNLCAAYNFVSHPICYDVTCSNSS